MLPWKTGDNGIRRDIYVNTKVRQICVLETRFQSKSLTHATCLLDKATTQKLIEFCWNIFSPISTQKHGEAFFAYRAISGRIKAIQPPSLFKLRFFTGTGRVAIKQKIQFMVRSIPFCRGKNRLPPCKLAAFVWQWCSHREIAFHVTALCRVIKDFSMENWKLLSAFPSANVSGAPDTMYGTYLLFGGTNSISVKFMFAWKTLRKFI